MSGATAVVWLLRWCRLFGSLLSKHPIPPVGVFLSCVSLSSHPALSAVVLRDRNRYTCYRGRYSGTSLIKNTPPPRTLQEDYIPRVL